MSHRAKHILVILSFLIVGFSMLKMPNEKVWLSTANGKVCLRVLRNKLDQFRGFQLVEQIPAHEGLLYVVAPFAKKPNFWMKDVLQPLDIIFVSASGRILEVIQAMPYQRIVIKSPKNAGFAIELPAGCARKLKLLKGSCSLASFVANL